MQSEVEKPTFMNDAFISYSRKDIEFARKLEKSLEDCKSPTGLNVPQRNLVPFGMRPISRDLSIKDLSTWKRINDK